MIDWRRFFYLYAIFFAVGASLTVVIWIVFSERQLTMIGAATVPIVILLIVSIVTNQTGFTHPAVGMDYFGTLHGERGKQLRSEYSSSTALWFERNLVPIASVAAAVTLAVIGGLLYWLDIA